MENRAYDNWNNRLYRDAIGDFTELLHCVEDDVEYYVGRAECYYKDSSLFDATIDLNEAEMLNPDKETRSEIAALREKINEDNASSTSTHYDVLAVPQKATGDQIKLAFMNLSILRELDLQGSPNEAEKRKIQWKFALVEEAHATLSDSKARDEYDDELEQEKSGFICKARKFYRQLIRVVVPGIGESHHVWILILFACLFMLVITVYHLMPVNRNVQNRHWSTYMDQATHDQILQILLSLRRAKNTTP